MEYVSDIAQFNIWSDFFQIFKMFKNIYLLKLKPVYTLILVAPSPPELAVAKYWMTRLVFTVFPAPDSPLVINAYIQRNAVSQFVYNVLVFNA